MIKTIYEKYPRVWEKLKERYGHNNLSEDKYPIRIGFYKADIIIYYNDKNCLIPFSMLYGLLEIFFDENGIYTDAGLISLFGRIEFVPVVYEKDNLEINRGFTDGDQLYDNRLEAQKAAILKACEILNERL